MEGTFTVHLVKDFKVRGVRAKLICREEVSWATGTVDHENSSYQIHSGSCDHLNNTDIVENPLGNTYLVFEGRGKGEDGSNVTVSQGTHSYDFRFTIPEHENLPTTLHGTAEYSINYEVLCYLDIPMHEDFSATYHMNVLVPHWHQIAPDEMVPLHEELNLDLVRCCCFPCGVNGEFIAIADSETPAVLQGGPGWFVEPGTLNLSLTMINRSDTAVESFEVRLVRTRDVFTKVFQEGEVLSDRLTLFSEVVRQRIEPYQETKCDVAVDVSKINTREAYTIDSCLIDLQFFIVVLAHPEGECWPHLPVDLIERIPLLVKPPSIEDIQSSTASNQNEEVVSVQPTSTSSQMDSKEAEEEEDV